MSLSSSRIVWFHISKALGDNQAWAVAAFPALVQRATGYSEQWAFVRQTTSEETGAPAWCYEVQGLPNLDLVVDHIIHELTDAVLFEEWHSVTEDHFTFGSMRRDKPPRALERIPQAEQ